MRGLDYTSSNAKETIDFGKRLLPLLNKGVTISLIGDLGSGKTTLVKGIYQALFNKTPSLVNSPTFSYLNIYESSIYHFDLYRLESKDQFLSMGFDEYFDSGICIIEWPEIIESLIPDSIKITLKYLGQDKRQIEVR